jgi:hypothetical protein
MDFQSLPEYCGLPDSLLIWGEKDGHGKKPSMRLRDYAVMSLAVTICFQIGLCLVCRLWVAHESAELINSMREKQLQMIMRSSLF